MCSSKILCCPAPLEFLRRAAQARTCTVSYSINGNHFNLPQIFGRVSTPFVLPFVVSLSRAECALWQIGETLYLHGSVSSGFLKAMRTSGDICFSGMRHLVTRCIIRIHALTTMLICMRKLYPLQSPSLAGRC